MAYLYDLPSNVTSADGILVEVINSAPFLPPLMLLFIYFIVLLGGIRMQKTRIGTADYPMWSVIASLSTLMIALLMSVTAGIIRIDWLIIVVVITIFSGVWFFLDRRSTEI